MFSRETVTAQGEYGMCFCSPGRNYLAYSCIAVQGGLGQMSFHGVEILKKVLVGAPYVEPARLGREALSWCCDLSRRQDPLQKP